MHLLYIDIDIHANAYIHTLGNHPQTGNPVLNQPGIWGFEHCSLAWENAFPGSIWLFDQLGGQLPTPTGLAFNNYGII